MDASDASNADRARAIADAALFAGRVLDPGQPGAPDARPRPSFGLVFPRAFAAETGSDAWALRSECLIEAGAGAKVTVRLRFLHLVACEASRREPDRGLGEPDEASAVDRATAAGEEAVVRDVETPPLGLAALAEAPRRVDFAFAGSRAVEHLRDGHRVVGRIDRTGEALAGALLLAAEPLAGGLWRLGISVQNVTSLSEAASASRALAGRSAFASTHLILGVEDGAFVSMTDPPAEAAGAARASVNEGLWPVLVGQDGARDAVLASPILLYDYPRIAPGRPDGRFDRAEVDETLTVRVLTMTDAERREAAAADPRARALLGRIEALGNLVRSAPDDAPQPSPPDSPAFLAVGDRVRLKPQAGGTDIIDLVLAGKIAVVEAIETDVEDRVHVAVTIEDDPDGELGLARDPGCRYFFALGELEPLGAAAAS